MKERYPGKPLRVAGVAFRSEFGDVATNRRNILQWIEKAAHKGAGLVAFPEIALQGYCTDRILVRALAEPVEGPTCTVVHELAVRYGITAAIGMSLREGESVYNSLVFIGPGGYLGAQHKVHLCGNDCNYDPGHSWNTVRVGEWLVGSTICFDSEFPEAARIHTIHGAHLLVMSFATGRRNSLNQPAEPQDWKKELMLWAPSRAYDNRIFVVGLNHAGKVRDDNGYALANPEKRSDWEEWAPRGTTHRWPGYCFAIGPGGTLLAETEGQSGEENMVIVDLDPGEMERMRAPTYVKMTDGSEKAGHFAAVRRVETFGDILHEYGSFEG